MFYTSDICCIIYDTLSAIAHAVVVAWEMNIWNMHITSDIHDLKNVGTITSARRLVQKCCRFWSALKWSRCDRINIQMTGNAVRWWMEFMSYCINTISTKMSKCLILCQDDCASHLCTSQFVFWQVLPMMNDPNNNHYNYNYIYIYIFLNCKHQHSWHR